MSHALCAGNYGDVSSGQGARGQRQQNPCLVGEGHHLVVADVRMRVPVSDTPTCKMREERLAASTFKATTSLHKSKTPQIFPVGL